MTQEEIAAEIKKALEARRLSITFELEAVPIINHLLVMQDIGMIELEYETRETLQRIVLSGDWESDQNRTVIVVLTETFKENENWFIKYMAKALERAEAVIDERS